jgi:hypothetical protein
MTPFLTTPGEAIPDYLRALPPNSTLPPAIKAALERLQAAEAQRATASSHPAVREVFCDA